MNRIVMTSLVGTFAAAALVVGAGGAAFASTAAPTPTPKTTRTLESVQAAAKTATDKREIALSAAITKLDAAKAISASDKSTLVDRLNADLAGMKAIESKIAADTTLAAASADFKTIFTTYRVFAVAIPQARIASVVDRVTSIDASRHRTSRKGRIEVYGRSPVHAGRHEDTGRRSKYATRWRFGKGLSDHTCRVQLEQSSDFIGACGGEDRGERSHAG
jgi:hypothetical protein